MFRMGGSARVNYQNGTTLEELIKKRGELRGQKFDTSKTSSSFICSCYPNG